MDLTEFKSWLAKCRISIGQILGLEKRLKDLEAGGPGGTTDHAALIHLGYADAGHMGFASATDLTGKVDKVTGKGLSTEDYSTAEQTKLSGIAAGADATGSNPTFGDVTVTGLSGSVISSESVEVSIEELDASQYAEQNTGFDSWTSGADASTYTITGGKFQIDRTGVGFIKGKRIAWASGQQTGALSANNCHWVYIDSAGVLQSSTSYPSNTIILFEVLYDGTNYDVVKENHPYKFNTAASGYFHNNINTTIRGTGAIITRVATGTGAAAGDRQIKIVGTDTLDDHGISSTISDSAGAAVTLNVYYRNGSGKWTRYVQQTGLPPYYNNAGTPTALDVVNAFAVGVVYVSKDDIENSVPPYFVTMGETTYTTLALAQAAITAGSVIFETNELKSLELCQLGYAIVQYSPTGGYINSLQVAKQTFNQVLVGGAAGSDHALLGNLAYAASGHTGFEPSLGFTAVPNTRMVAGHALSGDVTVSKSDVGLANVDNTTDAGKPVSTATQTALDGKISHSLAVAANDFLVASGIGVYVKKTLAEVKTILGLGSAAYTASTDYAVAAKGVTNGDSHDHSGGDGAQIIYSTLGSIPGTFAPASHDNTAHSVAYALGSDLSTHTGLTATAHGGLLPSTAFVGFAKLTVATDAPGGPGVGDLWVDLP